MLELTSAPAGAAGNMQRQPTFPPPRMQIFKSERGVVQVPTAPIPGSTEFRSPHHLVGPRVVQLATRHLERPDRGAYRGALGRQSISVGLVEALAATIKPGREGAGLVAPTGPARRGESGEPQPAEGGEAAAELVEV